MPDIHSSYQIKNVQFPNRIVMAPMVRFGYVNENGVMGRRLLDDHLSRAGCGAGLVISEALYVTDTVPVPSELSWRAGVWSDEHIEYLRTICDSYHSGGSVFFAQLAHPGFSFGDESARDINQISLDEIQKIRDGFIHASVRCRKAGLDGVEFHGAHTFFLNSLASATANKRTDRYGGDIAGRMTLIQEIIEGVRQEVGDEFLLGYRMGWTENIHTDMETAQALEKLGLDILHVSTGIPRSRGLSLPDDFIFNEVVYSAALVKKNVTVPVISVNQIRTAARGSRVIEQGISDFVAFGKPFLADIEFALKAKIDAEYMPCLECRGCQWFTDGARCPMQIRLGQAH